MKRLFRFLSVAIFCFFILPAISYAVTRGIKVTDKHGENLYLYKDYHAVIVGISNYEWWPKLPNAANDAKEVKNGEIQKVKLRDTQKVLTRHEIKKMIKEHNFCVKKINEEGDFPNDCIDNGDGTIADRVTGLMWGKECSSKLYQYYGAEKYILGLNSKEFAGYNDWRIPTLEELCSLLERRKNKKGLHISPLFDDRQSLYLNVDRPNIYNMEFCAVYHAIDFRAGVISKVATESGGGCHSKTFYIKRYALQSDVKLNIMIRVLS